MLQSGLKRSETIRDGKCYFLTWGVHVFRLRVAVGSVADGGFVGVRGELVIQLLGAVDEDGHALHLVTEEEKMNMECQIKTKKKKKTGEGKSAQVLPLDEKFGQNLLREFSAAVSAKTP